MFANFFISLVAFFLRDMRARTGKALPPLAVNVTPQNTLEIEVGFEDMEVTITEPVEHAGTYMVTLEDMVRAELYGEPIQLNDEISLVIN